jgi:hypothetical protein
MLAARILEIDRAGGDAEAKLRRLLETLTAEELETIPGRWIRDRGADLFWEDNLVDWATACLDR